MRRTVLTVTALAIYAASLAVPTTVGASYVNAADAEAYAERAANRQAAYALYIERVAAEAEQRREHAPALLALAVAVGAACEGSCAQAR